MYKYCNLEVTASISKTRTSDILISSSFYNNQVDEELSEKIGLAAETTQMLSFTLTSIKRIGIHRHDAKMRLLSYFIKNANVQA